MGRKKISISKITDERNRQVSKISKKCSQLDFPIARVDQKKNNATKSHVYISGHIYETEVWLDEKSL
jgi:hypothetical protein